MKISELKTLDPSFSLISGDADTSIQGISHSEFPKPNTFIFMKSKGYLNAFYKVNENKKFPESGVIFEKKFYESLGENQKDFSNIFSWVAIIDDVAHGMCVFSKPFYDEKFNQLNCYLDGRQDGTCEVDPNAEIAQNVFLGSNVTIAKNVKIYPGVVIMPEVTIGEGTVIFPNTTIYPYTSIGKNCRIHGNVTIGADGFGYHFEDGEHKKIWHFSGVNIGDNVEVGATSTIDAGAFILQQLEAELESITRLLLGIIA
jgi:UDP-3-O-[3-hydroxymyristoyl] glucosamine N-acyltransferase